MWGWFLVLFTGGTANAQVPTVPVSLGDALKTGITAGGLSELTKFYNEGKWKNLQDKAGEMIRNIPLEPLKSKGADNYVVLLWSGKDAAGEDALLWTFVHDPHPEAYATVLPGLKGTKKALYEVYLSEQVGAGFTSYYLSTGVEDPFMTQIPTVVERIAEPLFALFGGAAGVLPVRALPPGRKGLKAEPKEPIYAWVRQVALPIARADVKAHYFAGEPIPIEDFVDNAKQLAARLRFTTVSHSECGRGLASTLETAAAEVAGKSCLAPTSGDTAEQRKKKAEDCLKAFDDRFLHEYRTATSACPTDAAPRVVNREFRNLVTNWRPEKRKSEVTFQNRPLTHFGFGALTSFAFEGRTNKPRAKVDDGVLVEDPLPRAITAVVLNYNILGYNASSSRVGWEERLNLFGGGTITPTFGLTGGVNFVLVRGLGLNMGYARLFHLTKRDDDSFGQPPSDKLDPLGVDNVGVWFAGLSYNFK